MDQPSRLPRFFVLVIATAALLAQSASAWSFLWRDDDGQAIIEVGMKNESCKVIDHGKHQPFEWDPKDDHFCISVFSDKKCEKRAGYSCNPWPHDSTQDLKAFEVNGTLTDSDDIFKSSTMTSETQPATTTSSMTTSVIKDPPPATDTSTSLPQTDPEGGSNGGSDDNSLSGGAIAGIVIGVVAVFVLIIIAWMIFRRRRQSSTSQEPSTAGYSAGGSVPPVSESGATTLTANTAGESAQPISKWGAPTSSTSPMEEPLSAAPAYSAAPPEGTKLSELSTTNQIVELQGSDPVPPKSEDKTLHEKP